MWCLIIMAIMSWLLAFNVLNRGNPTVYRIFDFFERITEPVLKADPQSHPADWRHRRFARDPDFADPFPAHHLIWDNFLMPVAYR